MSVSYDAKTRYQESAVAAAYDEARFRGLRGRLVDWLEKRLLLRALSGLPAAARVLDLPVGTGRMARRLRSRGYEVVGADISPAMLGRARDLDRAAERPLGLVRADGEALPFADKTFDVAVCFRLMSHLPQGARVALLKEMARVASGAVVAVYQPHKLTAWWVLNGLILRKRVPLHFVSPRELEQEFAQAGLRPRRSHALLTGLLMERAYVLRPT